MTAHTNSQLLPQHKISPDDEYIDKKQINQKYSYYIISKPSASGNKLVFQHVEMNDGTVYLMKSNSQGTRDILPDMCRKHNTTQIEVRSWFTPYTFWY